MSNTLALKYYIIENRKLGFLSKDELPIKSKHTTKQILQVGGKTLNVSYFKSGAFACKKR